MSNETLTGLVWDLRRLVGVIERAADELETVSADAIITDPNTRTLPPDRLPGMGGGGFSAMATLENACLLSSARPAVPESKKPNLAWIRQWRPGLGATDKADNIDWNAVYGPPPDRCPLVVCEIDCPEDPCPMPCIHGRDSFPDATSGDLSGMGREAKALRLGDHLVREYGELEER